MASKRSNVGAIIGGTVAAAGVVGILGWWWYVYMKEAEAKYPGKKEPGSLGTGLAATVVEDEGTADQLAAEQSPGPAIPDPGHAVPTISLGGS